VNQLFELQRNEFEAGNDAVPLGLGQRRQEKVPNGLIRSGRRGAGTCVEDTSLGQKNSLRRF
jgi:hypothetical protein